MVLRVVYLKLEYPLDSRSNVRANVRLKEFVPNVNSIVEAPLTDKKKRRQGNKKFLTMTTVAILVSKLQKQLSHLYLEKQ